jgi:hypothetical protein
MIRNRTGLGNLTYSLAEKVGQSVQAPFFSSVGKLGSNISANLMLKSGEIVLREATHPQWQCQIKVVP